MNEPRVVINIEETIGKTVGKRRPPKDPLRVCDSNIKDAEAWRLAFNLKMPRRGVFRFTTHEEAHQWMMSHIGRR